MSNRVEEPVFEIEELILWLSKHPDMPARPALIEWIHAKAHETGESGIPFATMGVAVVRTLIEILGIKVYWSLFDTNKGDCSSEELVRALECNL